MMKLDITEHLYTPDQAENIAQTMSNNDPEWTYKAKHDPTGRGYSYIEIYDEEDILAGKL